MITDSFKIRAKCGLANIDSLRPKMCSYQAAYDRVYKHHVEEEGKGLERIVKGHR